MTTRARLLERLSQQQRWDAVVVGGGATGLGIALDATARGFRVLLVESHDFAKGTSSRATKLVHGGVRYLAQGDVSLVREALRERATLLRNAPHLAMPLPFVLPSYAFWQKPLHAIGLRLYDALAGAAGLGRTECLDRDETLRLLPAARREGLRGGVKYWDGQFDDARLALALARTAEQRGALLLNYCAATRLVHDEGRMAGIVCTDRESGREHAVATACVINATGVWVDALREQDAAAAGRKSQALVAPSQGVHLVVEREFLAGDHALLVPGTADGRVLFAVPWLGKTILGTTDTPREDLAREPAPFEREIDFILDEAARYLQRAPRREDVRSVWVGLRPLVKPRDDEGHSTRRLSREHIVRVSRSGLVSVTGGKWTTYRAMAEDVLEECFERSLLPRRPAGVTLHLPLVGAQRHAAATGRLVDPPGLHLYGDEADAVSALPGAQRQLGGGLSEAMVRFAARHEFARTVEDVLARRSRLLFLDARLAASLAGAVGEILAQETGIDAQAGAFVELARRYLPGQPASTGIAGTQAS